VHCGSSYEHPSDEDLSITPKSQHRSLGAPTVAGDPAHISPLLINLATV
jgi:hypothetical protein